LKIRSSASVEISDDANAAPSHARRGSTPTINMGGAIRRVRRTVHPTSLMPEPVFFSRTSAADRYVGIWGRDISTS
jgi:hypothetical protein